MKTKQQTIRDHWIALVGADNFDKLMLDENGFSDWRCRRLINPNNWNQLWDKLKQGRNKMVNGCYLLYQPKSLKGIHNNNGWNRIECVNDLPKASGMYLFRVDGRNVEQWFEEGVSFSKLHTHWREIQTLPQPLY